MNITKHALGEVQRKKIHEWILNNSLLEDDEGVGRAFAITYKTDQVPDILSFVKDSEYNIYNFIGLEMTNTKEVEPHIDTDYLKYMKTNSSTQHMVIGYPNTMVYYVDMCEKMTGGEIVVGDVKCRPVIDSIVTIPRGIRHSVTQVHNATRPRIALACERYKVLKRYYDEIITPDERPG